MQPTAATRDIATVAARQHGNVSLDQLRAAGLTRQQIRTRVGRGWLLRRHAAVYAVGHVPRSRASRFSAAVLALDGSVLSHRAAAAHWKIVRGPVPVDVTVPTTAGRATRDGITVHRAPLPSPHVTSREGIPVTTLLRTLLDLATVLRPHELQASFEEAQVLHHLPPEPLAAEVLSRRWYRGNRRLAMLLDGAVDPEKIRSILELRFLRLCALHGIKRPLVNERIGMWTPDFLWPKARVVVETDGVRFHRTAAKRRRDAEKDAFLVARGFQVIRLTWVDVTDAPGATTDRVRAALGATNGG